MADDPAVFIRVSRAAVERGDVARAAGLLEGFVPERLEDCRNRVVFQVDGYGDDKRELFEIEEVRVFFRRLFEGCPELFYWLEVSEEGILFLALMVCRSGREGDAARIAGSDLEGFLAEGFRGLEGFCGRHGLDSEPTEAAVTKLIRRKIGQ